MLASVIWIVVGLAILTLGADWLVRGSARLAVLLGVPPIAVGLTVVAFGTSTPELVVSVQGAMANKVDVAIGNVVGSNIFNIGFILGLASIVCPIPCSPAFVRREVPIMIATTVLVWIAGAACVLLSGAGSSAAPITLDRWTGVLFLGLLVVYTAVKFTRVADRAELEKEVGELADGNSDSPFRAYILPITLIVAGLVGLVVGASWFLHGSLEIARAIGVSELIIGLTLVAAGTSLPELATSVVAALRKHPDISIGNLVGSNVFNILGVLGASALIRPLPLSSAVVYRDLPAALIFAVLCMPIMTTGRRISRGEGVFLVVLYVAYSIVLYEAPPS